MDVLFASMANNALVMILSAALSLDIVLGILRAIKEHCFNSSAGIDGLIRKSAMLVCAIALAFVDQLVHIDVLSFLPEGYVPFLGMEKIGLCEFFCLLFSLYETVSILKNLTLCGAPVPKRAKTWIVAFLSSMTGELVQKDDVD